MGQPDKDSSIIIIIIILYRKKDNNNVYKADSVADDSRVIFTRSVSDTLSNIIIYDKTRLILFSASNIPTKRYTIV